MISAMSEHDDLDGPTDDGAAGHAHGSFFGRRKGHKLRLHQADLIENLLPRLSVDIENPARPISPTSSMADSRMSGSKSDLAEANI